MKNNFYIFIVPLVLCFTSCGEGVSTPHVTMFMTSIPTNGFFGNRQNADNLCIAEWSFQSNSLSKVSKVSNTHAMVSYNTGNDAINTMAQNYQLPDQLPIYIGNVKVSSSWNDLLQHGPSVQIGSAVALPHANFWTGSDGNGNVGPNCTNWTGSSCNYGNIMNSGTSFLFTSSISGSSSYGLMCVTF